jgi:hypothetical protein
VPVLRRPFVTHRPSPVAFLQHSLDIFKPDKEIHCRCCDAFNNILWCCGSVDSWSTRCESHAVQSLYAPSLFYLRQQPAPAPHRAESPASAASQFTDRLLSRQLRHCHCHRPRTLAHSHLHDLFSTASSHILFDTVARCRTSPAGLAASLRVLAASTASIRSPEGRPPLAR